MSKPKKLQYNGDSKVLKYLVTCANWFLDNHTVSTLDDVTLTNISNGQILKYDSTTHKFINYDESGGTEVEANPSDTATDDLEKIKIDGTVYKIDNTDVSASDVSYDNTTSGLTADDVQEAIDELADEKADKATTLSGYGITDTYTKTQIDNKLPFSFVIDSTDNGINIVYDDSILNGGE